MEKLIVLCLLFLSFDGETEVWRKKKRLNNLWK
jgi:hypothetical protein